MLPLCLLQTARCLSLVGDGDIELFISCGLKLGRVNVLGTLGHTAQINTNEIHLVAAR